MIGWTFREKEKEGKMVTQISVSYCLVHRGERKKHMKRTKVPLSPPCPMGGERKMLKSCVFSLRRYQMDRARVQRCLHWTHTCEAPFMNDNGSHYFVDGISREN